MAKKKKSKAKKNTLPKTTDTEANIEAPLETTDALTTDLSASPNTTEERAETTEHMAEEAIEVASEAGSASPAEVIADESLVVDEDAELALSEEEIAESAAQEAVEIPENLITDADEIERTLEAIIFASPKAITLRKIKALMRSFDFYVDNVTDYLESLAQKYENAGFQLVKVAGTYQFRSNPAQSDILQKLLEDKPVRISPSALEVLSIISYKQPVSRAEIDAVRGVDSGHLTRGLMEKNLIKVTGHAETPGRPLLYGTTPYFLEVFTLDSLDHLPSIEEFNRELSNKGHGSEEAEDAEISNADASELDEAAEFFDRDSPLAATPDRGMFDEPDEETIESPDFGLAERAREETP